MLSALLRQILGRPAKDATPGGAQPPVQRVLERARAHLAERRHEDASAALDRLLAGDPDQVEALVLKATILRRQRRLAEAKHLLERAMTLDPRYGEGWLELGTCYRLEDDPFWAHYFLRMGSAVDGGNADIWNELGLIEITLGNIEQAQESLETAANRNPELAEAWNNLGMILARRRDLENARRHFLRAVFLKPGFYMAACNLGLVNRDLERFEDAERELRRALELDPRPTAARLNLASVLQDTGRSEAALEMLGTAHAEAPQDSDVLTAMSAVHLRLGDGGAALNAAERALALAPDNADARLALATAQLASGDFAQGWENYEARLASGPGLVRRFPIARWNGEDLRGKRIFVYGEQGLGDEIMFASCIPDLIAAGAQVLLDCNARLRGLMRESFPGVEVLESLSRPGSPEIVDFEADLCAPLGSLPRFLRTSRERFAGGRPYLKTDARRVAAWRERLGGLGAGIKVGFAWRGGLARTGRSQRSIALDALGPLLRTSGVRWVSLQHDARAEEISLLETQHGAAVADWRDARGDMAETAALIAALDLVVTVCSTVVHLSGALGRETLVLTPRGPEWRYMLEGESMPWYGSVALLRQSRRNDWADVVAAAGMRLESARAALPQDVAT
jgi:tetratricopeptide (TPR) repeat protein